MPKVKFTFLDKSTLETDGKNFKKAVSLAVASSKCIKSDIMKVEFLSTGKILFFNDELFYGYAADIVPLDVLVKATECQGLFRNTVKMLTNTKEEIDADSLWVLKDNKLYLYDLDNHVTADPCELFVRI